MTFNDAFTALSKSLLRDDTVEVKYAVEAQQRVEKQFASLLHHQTLPLEGWSPTMTQNFLHRVAELDSNNFLNNVGAGEREGRVTSSIIRNRHFGLSHGIGRSGDVSAVQPKAIGSSLLAKLTHRFILHLLRKEMNLESIKEVLLLPLATGMAISLVLQTIRYAAAPSAGASASTAKLLADQTVTKGRFQAFLAPAQKKYVVWTRIDQKTCLKAIVTAGFIPIIVDNVIDETSDAIKCDVEKVEEVFRKLPVEEILCVISVTSCFAPRVPDDIYGIAKLCKKHNVFHVINNAYGLQCTKICHKVNLTMKDEENCRVDFVVQSTDKNFLVPVGGSLVFSRSAAHIEKLSKTYAGRASISPILDLFISLLETGRVGYLAVRKQRATLVPYFIQELTAVTQRVGERLLVSTANTISFAITLTSLLPPTGTEPDEDRATQLTKFGSMLFARGVSGARVVPRAASKTVAGISFKAYGSSIDDYHSDYFTVACAIGISQPDIDLLVKRIEKCFKDYKRPVRTHLLGSDA